MDEKGRDALTPEEPDYGCRYHPRGVVCTGRKECVTCGWNPAVAAERKRAIRMQRAVSTDGTYRLVLRKAGPEEPVT